MAGNSTAQYRWKTLRLPGLMLVALLVVGVFAARTGLAANPTSGNLSPAGPDVTWVGTGTGPAAPNGEADCATTPGVCDEFTLNVTGNQADWAGKQIEVEITWLLPATDYDMYVYKDSVSGTPIGNSAAAPPATSEVVNIDVGTYGTGAYVVRVVYFAATPTDQYSGKAAVTTAPAPPPPPPPGAGPAARYKTYEGPKEDVGIEGAEPTLGANWQTGSVMYLAFLHALRINFNDCIAPATAIISDTFANQTTSNIESLDPILTTDHLTGRTFVHQLTLNGGLAEFTDDDGETYTPMEGGRLNQGVDHQAIGAGPYRPGSSLALTDYPNAVYYCSQSVAAAFCARSDNGGISFNPGVPIYTSVDCGVGGLHGHVKVGPDGRVYVPKPECIDNISGERDQLVSVSEDNGLTWKPYRIPGTNGTSFSDPSLGIATDGTVYIGMQDDNPVDGGSRALASMSTDSGKTWSTPYDVGAQFGIKNAVFPAVVAGDGDRAAFAFIGTTTPGDHQAESFTGEWHMYVAHTYDRGQTWVTTDITPNDPVQRRNICGSGDCRNLLDFFDADVDKEGRMLVGYADGCIGPCVNTEQPADGSPGFRARGIAFARQSGGRRLFAQYDPVDPSQPDPPKVCNPEGTPIPLPTVTVTVCPVQFADVPQSSDPSSFYPFIRCLACRNIMSGYPCGAPGEPCPGNYFRPANNITRGQLAKIVSNSAGFNDQPAGQQFEDIPPTETFYTYIERLAIRHYIGGYPCGGPGEACGEENRPYFRSATQATRGQISKIVANSAGLNDPVTGQTYTDVEPSNDESSYYQYVERLSQRGVMGGYPCGSRPDEPCDGQNRPYFRPNDQATRGQTSKIVSNTFYPNCQTPARPK